jgi:hypothetical protein
MQDSYDPALSNEAWEAANAEEDEKEMVRDAERFLDGAVTVARFIRNLTADRDQVPGSAVIGFIIDYGLEKNPEAAVMARAEYRAFLGDLPDPIPAMAVDDLMLQFYVRLENRFKERGIEM